MKRFFTVLLILVLALGTLAACAGNDLVGEWSYTVEGHPSSMTFYKNGTGTIVNGTLSVSMEWEVDGDELIMLIDDGELKIVYTYQVEEDVLTLKTEGETITLNKK